MEQNTPLSPHDVRISGVIVARNEENKIALALESVKPIVQEIIFFDMDSSDRTAAIAESYGITVCHVPATVGQEPVRPRAVEMAAGDWILMFDADEVISPALRERLLRVVRDDEADVVSMPRQNYLFGKVMTGARMGANDDRQIRFFKKGSAHVSPLLHLQPIVAPGARLLELNFPEDGAIVHFNYVDINNYLDKFSRYTLMEAEKPSAAATYTLRTTILKAGWEFVNRYILSAGYRDGWRGLYVALAMSFYRLTIWARVCERKEFGSTQQIEAFYRSEARATLTTPLSREESLTTSKRGNER